MILADVMDCAVLPCGAVMNAAALFIVRPILRVALRPHCRSDGKDNDTTKAGRGNATNADGHAGYGNPTDRERGDAWCGDGSSDDGITGDRISVTVNRGVYHSPR